MRLLLLHLSALLGLIYAFKCFHIKLNDFVLYFVPFWCFWLPERLINLHLCTELTGKKNFPAFSHQFQPVSAREHRFNFVMVDRSMAALWRLHLAWDHSSVNCAINWGVRNRGLLLSCSANTFVLHVFGVSANTSAPLHTSTSSAAKPKTPFPHKQFQFLGRGKVLMFKTLARAFYCVFGPT